MQGLLHEEAAVSHRRSALALFVLDEQFSIVLHYSGELCGLSHFVDHRSERLHRPLERTVRGLVTTLDRKSALQVVELGRPYVLAVSPLRGAFAGLIAVSIEPLRTRNSLARAAERFALTRREIDVLTLILDGATRPEIAEQLCIAETTVQGYFKQLLSKTETRSRATMVARVLDWESGRFAREHETAI